MAKQKMEVDTPEGTDLVRYSRAGDAFHYRWAARRCLHMVNPQSPLKSIWIEGSQERKQAGEYVIDVAEYRGIHSDLSVEYFQLKHSTRRLGSPFNLSDLKNTFEGFSERYVDNIEDSKSPLITSFTILTNRKLSENLKSNIEKVINKDNVNKRFLASLKKYTGLDGDNLIQFCSLLSFEDSEGNYLEQSSDLRDELSELVAGTVDNEQIDTLIALVTEKALPDKDGKIIREEVLKRLGASSDRDFFPAPPELEELKNPIQREQHEDLLQTVINTDVPIIIHAEGGVGKSVVCRQLAESLPAGCKGIIYDCFGGGKYRSKIFPRHHYRNAMVQIANELAEQGLCEFLIPRNYDLDDALIRALFSRLEKAVEGIKRNNSDAFIVLFIDAADNAEMAAELQGDSCFAHQLLQEELPEGVKLVELCRTERIHKLKPPSYVRQELLKPFSLEETKTHIGTVFSEFSELDGMEFLRLTSGNPRVQANALSMQHESITEVLSDFGSMPISIDDQIAKQLESAINRLKDEIPLETHQQHIDAICIGLANLPPFIPINVLASAADVNESAIKSFVSDLGHPLWISENAVQFRDEPTETWFRDKFPTNTKQFRRYIDNLKPLAGSIAYVAEVLPLLLLQGENYKELIELALSCDKLLPDENPIEARNIRLFRLQFAFKAALKQDRYADAARLAMLAGEEVAGDDRQYSLLKENIDLIGHIQSEQRIQDLAFRRSLSGAWQGSENLYTASLLSTVPSFQGEARSYLRSGLNWLRIYFQERDKENSSPHEDKFTDEDIIELAFAHYRIFGKEEFIRFSNSWRPPVIVRKIVREVIKRLIDSGDWEAINEIASLLTPDDGVRYQYFCLEVASELWRVAKELPVEISEQCLDELIREDAIREDDDEGNAKHSVQAINSFAEACVKQGLSSEKIITVLEKYSVFDSTSYEIRSDHQWRERYEYLRSVALRAVLTENVSLVAEDLLPKDWLEKEKKRNDSRELREYNELIGGMLPWHLVRASVIAGKCDELSESIEKAKRQSSSARSHRYQDYDTLHFEITNIQFEILAYQSDASELSTQDFAYLLKSEKTRYRISDRLEALRLVNRSSHLSALAELLEISCQQIINLSHEDGPEAIAGWYVDLARSVLPNSKADAMAYFDKAVEVLTKFGDEMTERWEAVVSLAQRSAESKNNSPELAYRFIRCAEMIGDQVTREKHWHRSGAIQTCAKMSPHTAIASLSRWRDRHIGWLSEQLPALIKTCLLSDYISPSVAWSFTGFFGCLNDIALIETCFRKESDKYKKEYMLSTSVRDLLLNESPYEKLGKLRDAASEVGLEYDDLEKTVNFKYQHIPREESSRYTKIPARNSEKKEDHHNWAEILEGLSLVSSEGIDEAIRRFDSIDGPRDFDEFWNYLFQAVDVDQAINFIPSLINAESADRYDIERALDFMPDHWKSKASVKRQYPVWIQKIARRFAHDYTRYWVWDRLVENLQNQVLIERAKQGVLEGLSEGSDFMSASAFFGFVSFCTNEITPNDAMGVLDFSLVRFEKHIPDDFGDGQWRKELNSPCNSEQSIAGFIWSALGAPESRIRWEAVHCVKRLLETGCADELRALIGWMKNEEVYAFGADKYPFYPLHAKQYLLIALQRVSIDDATLLKPYIETFINVAFSQMSHALIQPTAASIVLNIAKQFPNELTTDEIEKLKSVGVSPFPIKKVSRTEAQDLEISFKDISSSEETSVYFGYDFDRYWFEPLGNVFGLPASYIEKLASDIVLDKWNIEVTDKHIEDPRNSLWRYDRDRETWHSHSSYPSTDTYQFYLSYHAMLVVAQKLLKEVPIIITDDWCDNEWIDWLHRHSLTRTDGKWLSDRRDPPPMEQRNWLQEERTDTWRWEIAEQDFLDGLLRERNGETWLNVSGYWNECDSSRNESYRVSSAFVDPVVSKSLLAALTTCNNPSDYKIPDYQESGMEFEEGFFNLRGWISHPHVDKRLDERDPHAGNIDYPTLTIGDKYVRAFMLEPDYEGRFWTYQERAEKVFECIVWGDKPEDTRSEFFTRRGERLCGSLFTLKNICKELEKDMIIEVQITRSVSKFYNQNEDDDVRYQPPYSKVYLLNSDGILRDTGKSYQLGEKTRSGI